MAVFFKKKDQKNDNTSRNANLDGENDMGLHLYLKSYRQLVGVEGELVFHRDKQPKQVSFPYSFAYIKILMKE